MKHETLKMEHKTEIIKRENVDVSGYTRGDLAAEGIDTLAFDSVFLIQCRVYVHRTILF